MEPSVFSKSLRNPIPSYPIKTGHYGITGSAVKGVSTDFNYDSGFQGMLLQDNQTGEFVITFRGTEPDQGPGELYNDLIVADILYMGTGRGPQQMKDAMDFVNKMINIHELDSTNTNFTGHSLGGALAGMASYVYGFETYTYNGFGIKNMLWDVNDTCDNYSLNEFLADDLGIVNTLNPFAGIAEFETLGEYLEANNIEIKHEEDRVTNIIHIGHSRTDLVGGIATDIVSGQIGESYFVVNNTGAAGGLLNTHSMENLNDSIVIYNNALALFPDEDYNSITDIIMNIKPDPKKIERFLTSLGEVVRVAHSDNLIELSEYIGNSGITSLTLNSLAESSTSSLESQAGSLAGMYALLNLNPFTITGANYSHLNQDGELDSANYSDQYIEDRAKFLYYLSHPDTTVSNFDPDIDFVDNRLGISRTVDNGMMRFQDDSQYLFGNLEGELLKGEDEIDHLYGSSPKAFSPHRAVLGIAA
ncbi:hypothetical protein JWJ90_22455 [Desulfobulbus rhabdoformis]|uniref:hypothetical protein n=1 Tax=Desulfobulbus rhabdoformis TaxID=34032 RepID=UPI0019622F43|nr:hypothetical protein [Desulfobulbus rhabdoformis]MBM9617025.1 hypothetical protein [Desulfobulbus rhabdoformis]